MILAPKQRPILRTNFTAGACIDILRRHTESDNDAPQMGYQLSDAIMSMNVNGLLQLRVRRAIPVNVFAPVVWLDIRDDPPGARITVKVGLHRSARAMINIFGGFAALAIVAMVVSLVVRWRDVGIGIAFFAAIAALFSVIIGFQGAARGTDETEIMDLIREILQTSEAG